MNPPDPMGRLETTKQGNVTLAHFTSSNTRFSDYWNGSNKTFKTKELSFKPNYNQLQAEPVDFTMGGVVYRNASPNYLIDSQQNFIEGRNINLHLIQGNLSVSGINSDVKWGVTSTYRFAGLTNSSAAPHIIFPSGLPTSKWNETLSNQSEVKSVTKSGNRVNITLKKDTLYRVRISVLKPSKSGDQGVGEEWDHPVVGNTTDGTGDLKGPDTYDVKASPNKIPKRENFDLTATVTDSGYGGSPVVDAEWYKNTTGDPGYGKANSMLASDGVFNKVTEDVEKTGIDTSNWATGKHTINIRGKDGDGNWGKNETVTVTVQSSAQASVVKGISYKEPDNSELDIFYYRNSSGVNTTNTIHSNSFDQINIKPDTVGGIMDWNNDGNISETVFINTDKNNNIGIYDNNSGTTTYLSYNVQNDVSQELIGFPGDFNDDGNVSGFIFSNNSRNTNRLEVIRYNRTQETILEDRWEVLEIKEISTGSLLNKPKENNGIHVTGTANIDKANEGPNAGQNEFAYIRANPNQVLVIVHIEEVKNSAIYGRVEVADMDYNNFKPAQIGGIGDIDDDGYSDDIVFKDGNSKLRFYDYSRDKSYIFVNKDIKNIGPVLDTDSDGKDEVYYVGNNNDYFKLKEVGSLNTNFVGDSVGNKITINNEYIGGGN